MKTFTVMLQWALAAGVVFSLPCCLVLQLELHPDTTYLDHLPGTFALLAGGFLALVRPSPAPEPISALPDAHADVFRYAIRSGVLPIASIFSDWSGELSRLRALVEMTLRSLPTTTGAVLAMEMYGLFMYPAGRVFFFASALASTVFSLVAFSCSAVTLKNVGIIEERLRVQQQHLQVV